MKIIYIKDPKGESHEIYTDDCDHGFFNKLNWFLDNHGYPITNTSILGRNPVRMHTLVIKRANGCVIDHINRNKKDNRSENLRNVPGALNSANTNSKNVKLRENGTYQAQLRFFKRSFSFGCFESEEEAYKVVSAVKQTLFDFYLENGFIPPDVSTLPGIAKFRKVKPTREQLAAYAKLGGIASSKVWTEKKKEASMKNIKRAQLANTKKK